jgi:hypothetical protein
MKSRVKSEGRHKRWYKDKNITIDPEWTVSFEAFFRDMGECTEGMTLDRLDGTKGYYKENCRWITQKEQNRNNPRNFLITLDGRTQCAGAWAEETGLNEGVIRKRIKGGWDSASALLTPKWTPRLYTVDGEMKTLREWATVFGKTISILKQRLKRGWRIEDALRQPIHTKFASFHHKKAA